MNFIYDGSFEGFLSALEKAVKVKDSTISKDNLLFNENIAIKDNDSDKTFSKNLYFDLLILYLSETKDFENIALNYAKLNEKERKNINNEHIRKVYEIKRKYFRELHKFKGLTRFYEIDENLLFSKIAPDNNILIFLAEHFKKRVKENFIIYDEKRNIGAIRNQNDIFLQELKDEDIKFYKTRKEQEINNLWKKFFNEIAIKERINYKLQRNFVPLKYRKNITEFIT
ncbi:MAG: TIGR03915 family putative DNA repair protein [Elusimicrobiota bacterium]